MRCPAGRRSQHHLTRQATIQPHIPDLVERDGSLPLPPSSDDRSTAEA